MTEAEPESEGRAFFKRQQHRRKVAQFRLTGRGHVHPGPEPVSPSPPPSPEVVAPSPKPAAVAPRPAAMAPRPAAMAPRPGARTPQPAPVVSPEPQPRPVAAPGPEPEKHVARSEQAPEKLVPRLEHEEHKVGRLIHNLELPGEIGRHAASSTTLPPPPPPREPVLAGPLVRLIVTSGADVGTEFDLVAGNPLLGRDPAAAILLTDDTVSHQHARLHVAPGQVTIEDLKSTNHTRVNGQQIEPRVPVPLKHGDQLDMGGVHIVVDAHRALGPRPV